MNRLISIVLILFPFYLSGQSKSTSDTHNNFGIWTDLGFGASDRTLGPKLDLDCKIKRHLFSISYQDLKHTALFESENLTILTSSALMYGRYAETKAAIFSLSSGIAIVDFYNYKNSATTYIGLPVKGQIIVAYKIVGIGVSITGNLNKGQSYVAWGLSLSLGKIK